MNLHSSIIATNAEKAKALQAEVQAWVARGNHVTVMPKHAPGVAGVDCRVQHVSGPVAINDLRQLETGLLKLEVV